MVESTNAANPLTNTATQTSNAAGKIIMVLDKNGQNQIKFSGLTITGDFLPGKRFKKVTIYRKINLIIFNIIKSIASNSSLKLTS